MGNYFREEEAKVALGHSVGGTWICGEFEGGFEGE
jgi:hypothetical protein